MRYKERNDLDPVLVFALKHIPTLYQSEVDGWLTANYPAYKDRHISVTALAKPPRQRQLFARHHDEFIVDPMDNYYSIYGTALHQMMEMLADQLQVELNEPVKTEQRIGRVFKVNGEKWLVHGQLDLYYPNSYRLVDHKYCSVWTAMEEQPEYDAQLNVLKYLAERQKTPMPVEEIFNSLLFRDWRSSDAKRLGDRYPTEKAMYRHVDVWPEEKTRQWVVDRLKMHISNSDREDDQLTECTPEEIWCDWRVIRKSKRTKRWNKTPDKQGKKEVCEEYLKENKGDEELKLEQGVPKRCLYYCQCNVVCNQFKAWQKENNE